MADFAQMLKYLREREGLTQRELADRLDLSAGAIGMYESGKRHPKFEDEEKIADFFNVDLNTLRGKRIDETDPDSELVRRALKYYDLFSNATPEAQSAVELLLKSSQQPK